MIIQEKPFGNLGIGIGIGINFGVAKNHIGITNFALKNSIFMFFLLLSYLASVSLYHKYLFLYDFPFIDPQASIAALEKDC